MSTSALAYEARRGVFVSRLRDYAALARPRIAIFELVTVAVAACLASHGPPATSVLAGTLLGTLLVAASASALNQWLEAQADARMPRTAGRPLPAGRVGRREVLLVGGLAVVVGVACLWIAANVTAALVALASWLLYVAVYTPLKRITPLNTIVGAVAGALPVWIGWTAAGGRLGLEAWALLLIVYLWQFPHFMAIAWIYRREYAAAGMRMWPTVDPSGHRAGRQAVVSAAALMAVACLPGWWQMATPLYFGLALLLAGAYLAAAVAFARERSDAAARRLLRWSLVYLPGQLALLVVAPLV